MKFVSKLLQKCIEAIIPHKFPHKFLYEESVEKRNTFKDTFGSFIQEIKIQFFIGISQIVRFIFLQFYKTILENIVWIALGIPSCISFENFERFLQELYKTFIFETIHRQQFLHDCFRKNIPGIFSKLTKENLPDNIQEILAVLKFLQEFFQRGLGEGEIHSFLLIFFQCFKPFTVFFNNSPKKKIRNFKNLPLVPLGILLWISVKNLSWFRF